MISWPHFDLATVLTALVSSIIGFVAAWFQQNVKK